VRLLQALHRHRHVLQPENLALEIDLARLQALQDNLVGLGVDPGGCLRIDAEIADLVRRNARPTPKLEAAAAHLVEHADFLENAQRMAQGQDVDQRPEAQPLGALGNRRQQHAGHTGHAERRRVMLGDMIGVEAAAVVDLGKLEPALIELREA